MRADGHINFGRDAVPVNRAIVFGQHSDDRERFTVQLYCPPKNAHIRAEFPLPKTVTQYHNTRLAPCPTLVAREGSAEEGSYPQDVEKVSANDISSDFLQVVSRANTQAGLIVG